MVSVMKHLSRVTLLAWTAGLAACDDLDTSDGPSEKTRASWVLALKVDGADVKLPLEYADDITVQGRISLLVRDETGPATLEGTFAVHAVTWG